MGVGYYLYELPQSFRLLEKSGWLSHFRAKKRKPHERWQYAKFENNVLGSSRIFAYINGVTSCCSNCGFCRLSEMEESATTFNRQKFLEFYQKYGRYIRTYTFGGGEPLLYMQDIFDLYKNPDIFEYPCSKAIITSAPRDLFFKWYNWERESSPFLESRIGKFFRKIFPIDLPYSPFEHYVDTLYISRHHWDDEMNQKSFNSSVPLLSWLDIKGLPKHFKQRIVFAVTCYNGEYGISTVRDMKKMIASAQLAGISKVIFNDLQPSMTDKEYYKEHQIPKILFSEARDELRKMGFHHDSSRDIAFSGGYYIATFTSSNIDVAIKEYRYGSMWRKTDRRTYDLTFLPSGKVLFDNI